MTASVTDRIKEQAMERLRQIEESAKEKERRAELCRDRGFSMTSKEIYAWAFASAIRLRAEDGLPFSSVTEGIVRGVSFRSRLPNSPGVYFISEVDSDGFCKPVYIGMSESSVRGRLSLNHHAIAEISAEPEYNSRQFCVHVVEPPLDMSVRLLESAAISRWNPSMNKEKPFHSADEIESYLKETKEILDDYSFF